MDEVVKEFLVESYENLDRLDRDLVALEKDPRSAETLASIFRTIHTIKGTSGFLAYTKLEAVAHVGENLLSKLRDGVLTLNPQITSALLAMGDAVRFMLGQIESTDDPGTKDYSDLVDLLTRLNDEAPAEVPEKGAVAATPETALMISQPISSIDSYEHIETATSTQAEAQTGINDETLEGRELSPDLTMNTQQASFTEPSVEESAASLPPGGNEVGLSTTEELINADQKTVSSPAADSTAQSSDAFENRGPGVSDSTIRVDVGLLDKLMNLVGELVLARNQVLQFSSHRADSAFLATSQRLNLITTELQENVMKTRMQPIGNVWSKLPRVVRDLATHCGKEVRIEMVGKETELDKTIIEAIKDPLTHIVRNAVDHGIESPEIRIKSGKPAEGCLKMRAYHEGGQVNIEITDDGGGIRCDRVKQKALQKGLATPEQIDRMSEHEALRLIFLPGFSTAEKITNVSGRGVGMDVVKTNIEKIGGTVDIQSHLGQGTTLKIKIPLTLAIIPALIVTSGGDRFAIPQVSLLELVRLEGDQARQQIEFIHGSPVYRLRGQLLPLAYLNRELKLNEHSTGSPNEDRDAVNIVVLQADGYPFGLVVDEINDTEEIVVKPLGKQLKGVTSFAGATIMGDGKVALILDVLGIAQSARVVAKVRERSAIETASQSRRADDNRKTLLVFEAGQGSRMAIPLSMVARLEEFPQESVEYSGTQQVVRYRGQILPIIRVSEQIPAIHKNITSTDGPMQVVVYSEQGRSVGLVVGRINDIVEETINVKRHACGKGIFGSVVIQDKVTDLLDVQAVIRAADPSFFGASQVSS